MDALLRFFELLAMVLWLGSVVFFSFFTAPVLFRVFGVEQAGRAVRTIFPRYYLLGLICGVILCVVSAARGLMWTWNGMILPSLVLFVVLTAVIVYARQSLTPRINAARDAGEARRAEFTGLHKRSVRLNGFVLVLLFLYLVWIAARGW
jgi:hypothetical protein